MDATQLLKGLNRPDSSQVARVERFPVDDAWPPEDSDSGDDEAWQDIADESLPNVPFVVIPAVDLIDGEVEEIVP